MLKISVTLFTMMAIAMVSVVFISCEKDQEEVNPQQESKIVISKVDNVVDMTNTLKQSTTNWGSYPMLYDTKNRSEYFSPGLYAVKIERSWYNGTITIDLVTQNQSSDDYAYVWAYEYDDNGNQTYYSGVKRFSSTEVHPIPKLYISGDESVVLVLKVNVAGDYLFNY